MTIKTTIPNTEKRSFLKTLVLSLAFISFGGLGSIIKSFLTPNHEPPKSGFGSNGYGL
jgi:hypothetical protein